MTTLSFSEAGELNLTLRGEAENRILSAVRRWPHWQRVAVERDPEDAKRFVAITLVTDSAHEATLRDILKRSFGMTFPETGGSCELEPEPPAPIRRRRKY